MQPHPLLLVISGPSGVGKDSLVTGIKERGVNFHFVVTATSRPPRPGEEEGIDYFFVSRAEFEAMIEQDALIEYAVVYGQYKGVPKQQVQDALDSGKDVVMRLDVQGATTVKRLIPGAVLLFLSAASEEELMDRLKRRKTEDDQQLQRRIETARAEMAQVDRFDYVVINRDGELDAAVDRALDIIHAEHARVHPRQVTL
jgi:guanylate kinase